MVYSQKLRNALNFAIDVHQVKRNQKRKGKDIPYVAHPLTVGLILSCAGADEDTIVAGLLHDTIEDSAPEFAVTPETLREKFGDRVASLVDSVTEHSRDLTWRERKKEALTRVAGYSWESLLIKSADVLSNDWELVEDFERDGNQVFDRFNVSKVERLRHQLQMIEALIDQSPRSPLAKDLRGVAIELRSIQAADPVHTLQRKS